MSLKVDPQPIGKKLFRLAISHMGQYIGEYERSQAADIDRKTQEIDCAEQILLSIYKSHGEFQVRWDGKNKVKSIRFNKVEVAQIPKSCWGTPSWQKSSA